ncbi:MAG: hypothetical protein ACPGSC_08215, partial [Granulosicoccaceae bacterium]
MDIQQSGVLPLAHSDEGFNSGNQYYGHYLLAVFSLSVYGGQVCPYVESLGLLDNAQLLSLLFLSMAVLRPRLYRRFVDSHTTWQRMLAVAKLDIALYFSAAIVLSAYFFLSFDTPLSTAIKLIFGFGFLGGFAAMDAALLEQRDAIAAGNAPSEDDKTVSLGRTINQFTLAVCVGLVTTMLLLVAKDMEWLLSEDRQLSDMQATLLVGLEFFVVLAVVLLSSMHVVNQYSKNLQLRLKSQTDVLTDVGRGLLKERIHDPGNDELKYLSIHINK